MKNAKISFVVMKEDKPFNAGFSGKAVFNTPEDAENYIDDYFEKNFPKGSRQNRIAGRFGFPGFWIKKLYLPKE